MLIKEETKLTLAPPKFSKFRHQRERVYVDILAGCLSVYLFYFYLYSSSIAALFYMLHYGNNINYSGRFGENKGTRYEQTATRQVYSSGLMARIPLKNIYKI
jgi:hypothetical protein